ncbi:MAG: hypothetical protein KatS3mg131_3516 [Candidatus Tectimicrobiota bacterium]|nr:MAG: hypothetical protein KatS3mg131_3516 [Candidatus Tectomicrobia bacterium]
MGSRGLAPLKPLSGYLPRGARPAPASPQATARAKGAPGTIGREVPRLPLEQEQMRHGCHRALDALGFAAHLVRFQAHDALLGEAALWPTGYTLTIWRAAGVLGRWLTRTRVCLGPSWRRGVRLAKTQKGRRPPVGSAGSQRRWEARQMPHQVLEALAVGQLPGARQGSPTRPVSEGVSGYPVLPRRHRPPRSLRGTRRAGENPAPSAETGHF